MARYQGAILDVQRDGAERLKIEREYDETVRKYLADTGTPDYIYVANRTDLEVVYLRLNRLVHFHRPALYAKSAAAEVAPIPEELLELLPGDKRILVHETAR